MTTLPVEEATQEATMFCQRMARTGATQSDNIRSATVRSTNIQEMGCAPCWKTATSAPEGSTQNRAFPLKNAGLVHSRVPVLLTENVVVISPGAVVYR